MSSPYDCMNCLTMLHCSFTDRILIVDPAIRRLIMKFVRKGLTDDEMVDLFRFSQSRCSFLMELLNHLKELATWCRASGLHHCPPLWKDFVRSIGCSSAVCALINPNQQSISLIKKLCDEDITNDPQVIDCFVLQHYFVFYVGNEAATGDNSCGVRFSAIFWVLSCCTYTHIEGNDQEVYSTI